MRPGFLIGVELVRHCNIRCVHCLRADTRTKDEMPPALFHRILDEARAYGKPHIAITGGEPTLHRNFFALLDDICAHDYTFHFVTNGWRLADLMGRLRGYADHLRAISFSMDGATEATHDRIRGRGSFRRLVLAVAMTRHVGIDVTVQMVVHRANRHELAALVELCEQLGVTALYVTHAQPTPALYAEGLQLSPDAWRAVEAEVRALQQRSGRLRPQLSVGVHDPGNVAPCGALKSSSLNIDFRGRLTLCCQLSGVSDGDDDVVADLNTVSLAAAHRRLLHWVRDVIDERVDGFASGSFNALDNFQCWRCYKRFGKLDWLAAYPDDPWAQAEPQLHRRTAGTPELISMPRRRRA